MSAAKENRRVVLKLPLHDPSKLVREEETLLSAPKTELILRMPLKRKRGENKDLDELEEYVAVNSESCDSEAEDITESEEDTDESSRGVEDTIDLLPPPSAASNSHTTSTRHSNLTSARTSASCTLAATSRSISHLNACPASPKLPRGGGSRPS
ncbi:hypothetical protein BDZ89DRAFT_1077368 [Hymenopellis radicata]|nr:hypothetical protein BDZ89DRAFT_1077368 [Hymenopellis radicata]